MDLDIDRYIKFVTPKPGDSTYSVLKAHLMIEEVMNTFLDRKLKHPEALKGARLSFAQRLCLVRSLARSAPDHWAYQAVEKLNSIRNSLAHERSPKDLPQKIKNYVELITANSGVPLPRPITADPATALPGPHQEQRYAAIDIATVGLYVELHVLLEIKDKIMIDPK